MKKKILSLCLVIALAAIAIIGGTLAYFTDTDKDVNTMVSGNVDIRQDEWMRNEDGTALIAYEDQTLMPAVAYDAEGKLITYAQDSYDWCYAIADDTSVAYTVDGLNDTFYMPNTDRLANVVDKAVTVTNTGSNPVYVRTILLIEDDGNETVVNNINFSYDYVWKLVALNNYENVVIGGKNYTVITLTYPDVLAKDETTLPSLIGFYLNPNVDQGIVPASFTVTAFSQAVQSEGFEKAGAEAALNAAFGEVTVENLNIWFASR